MNIHLSLTVSETWKYDPYICKVYTHTYGYISYLFGASVLVSSGSSGSTALRRWFFQLRWFHFAPVQVLLVVWVSAGCSSSNGSTILHETITLQPPFRLNDRGRTDPPRGPPVSMVQQHRWTAGPCSSVNKGSGQVGFHFSAAIPPTWIKIYTLKLKLTSLIKYQIWIKGLPTPPALSVIARIF